MITVESVAAFRAGVRVLEDVSLKVPAGTVTTLVGPSGSGKSTLLRCLNGLETLAAGAVEIAGHRLTPGPQSPRRLELLRRDVGMVFQQFNLFPHLSVLDNVALPPRVIRQTPAAAARAQAQTLLERVGLAHLADVRPTALSGGQQQRVAIARALAMEPRVMLFDEPTSALDPAMSGEVLEVILGLARAGQTMVVVTHDHSFARRVATQVAELVAGRVVRQGTAADLL